MPQIIDIRDGGTLLYLDAFYPPADADALFKSLRAETPWRQAQPDGAVSCA